MDFGGIVPPMDFGKEGFVSRLNSGGIWMWVRGAIGGWDERVLGLCTDKLNGFIYATGTSWTYPPTFGSCNSVSPGSADEIFVGKFDINGNCLWEIGAGSDGDDHGYDLVTDKQGNIFLTGFYGNHYGSGSPAIFGSISSPLPPGNDSMAFVTKISPDGTFQWVKAFGAIDGERDNRIAVDTAGNVYVVGGFHGTKQFGSQTVVSNGETDIFVVKFDNNGNQVWVQTTGSSLDDRANAVTVDYFNNIFITGEFRDMVVFGSDTINNYGGPSGRDIFVAKMRTDGTWAWAKRAGSTGGEERGNSIVANEKGNIFLTGQFTDTAKFGNSITLVNSTNSPDIFVAAIDTLGKWKWALQAGGIYDERGTGITCDSCNIFISGYYRDFASFGNVNLNSNGGRDAFVASITNACFEYCTVPIVIASADSICEGDSIILGGKYQSTEGIYYDTLIAGSGCDSILATTLTIIPGDTVTTAVAICDGDSIFLLGNYQHMAGIYYDAFSSGNGCINILAITLIVKSIAIFADSFALCYGDSIFIHGNYVNAAGIYYDTLTASNGCDSIISTTLTVNPTVFETTFAAICNGDSIFLAGNYQNTAGIYYDTLASVNGCDSIISTTLTINSAVAAALIADICNGDSILLQGKYQIVGGNYSDTLTTANGCDSIIETTLIVNSNASASATATIFNGDSIFLQGKYQTVEGNYYDTLTAANGCDSIIKTALTVSESSVFVPNIFTPNGDGKNDVFKITGIAISDFKIEIFNRWGIKVFETADKNKSWDGKDLQGQKVDSGVYYFVIISTDNTEIIKRGNVTLLK